METCQISVMLANIATVYIFASIYYLISTNDFGTPFKVTLKDVFRDQIISRGKVVSNQDIKEAEKYTKNWYEFVQKSNNPSIQLLASQNPPEMLIDLIDELNEFKDRYK